MGGSSGASVSLTLSEIELLKPHWSFAQIQSRDDVGDCVFWQLVDCHPLEFVAFIRFVIDCLTSPRIAIQEEIYVRHFVHSVHDSYDGEIVLRDVDANLFACFSDSGGDYRFAKFDMPGNQTVVTVLETGVAAARQQYMAISPQYDGCRKSIFQWLLPVGCLCSKRFTKNEVYRPVQWSLVHQSPCWVDVEHFRYRGFGHPRKYRARPFSTLGHHRSNLQLPVSGREECCSDLPDWRGILLLVPGTCERYRLKSS